MTREPQVSVLMTTYNRESYIAEAIRSVLSSTYADLELIVVDDGSTDGTLAIAEQFAEEDARVRVYRNERNLGDYPNRNRAASPARGKYLKYVDSDDLLYPYGLEAMVNIMEDFPSAGLGMSDLAPWPDRPFPLELTPAEAYREHFLGRRLFGHGPLATIIRAEAFRKVGGFGGFHVAGDLELWLRLAAQFPIVLMPSGFTWWRQHDGQEFVKGDAIEAYPRLVYRVNMDALMSPHCPLPTPERADALARVRRARASAALGLLRRGRFRGALRLYRERNGMAAPPAEPRPVPSVADSRTP